MTKRSDALYRWMLYVTLIVLGASVVWNAVDAAELPRPLPHAEPIESAT